MENHSDCPLIGWWSVSNPKRHYNPYKNPLINNKGDVLVLWCYGNLMVSKKTIKNV